MEKEYGPSDQGPCSRTAGMKKGDDASLPLTPGAYNSDGTVLTAAPHPAQIPFGDFVKNGTFYSIRAGF